MENGNPPPMMEIKLISSNKLYLLDEQTEISPTLDKVNPKPNIQIVFPTNFSLLVSPNITSSFFYNALCKT